MINAGVEKTELTCLFDRRYIKFRDQIN